jgi:phage-related protein
MGTTSQAGPASRPRALYRVGTSKADLADMPEDIKDTFGRAILDLEYDDVPRGARAFGEGLTARVMKLAADNDGNTFRAAYTIAVARAVYILHVFQKKSKSGIGTSELDKRRIVACFAAAHAHHNEH